MVCPKSNENNLKKKYFYSKILQFNDITFKVIPLGNNTPGLTIFLFVIAVLEIIFCKAVTLKVTSLNCKIKKKIFFKTSFLLLLGQTMYILRDKMKEKLELLDTCRELEIKISTTEVTNHEDFCALKGKHTHTSLPHTHAHTRDAQNPTSNLLVVRIG